MQNYNVVLLSKVIQTSLDNNRKLKEKNKLIFKWKHVNIKSYIPFA